MCGRGDQMNRSLIMNKECEKLLEVVVKEDSLIVINRHIVAVGFHNYQKDYY